MKDDPSTSLGAALAAPIRAQSDPKALALGSLARVFGPGPVPPARSVELHHIRGVGLRVGEDAQEEEAVLFTPEFLYVFDLGLPARAGVVLPYSVSGAGDPGFPKPSEARLRSITGEDPRDLLYPMVAGELLVAVQAGTPAGKVRSELSGQVISIEPAATDLYLAKVKPFHEPAIAQALEQGFGFVRYAEGNRIVRRNDFAPGWRIDRVL